MTTIYAISIGFNALIKDKSLHTVTMFHALPKERVRISRAKNGNGFHVTIGKPNFRERQWLKLCKKAGASPRVLKPWPFAK